MKISEFKNHLKELDGLNFVQAGGAAVPEHFHITEIGLNTKHFIDCGGTVRSERSANMQIWVANDRDHRLKAQKMLGIVAKSEKILGDEDLDLEVEYQSDTIGKYDLAFEDGRFVLQPKYTACLAQEQCGVPKPKFEIQVAATTANVQACCTPGGGCC